MLKSFAITTQIQGREVTLFTFAENLAEAKKHVHISFDYMFDHFTDINDTEHLPFDFEIEEAPLGYGPTLGLNTQVITNLREEIEAAGEELGKNMLAAVKMFAPRVAFPENLEIRVIGTELNFGVLVPANKEGAPDYFTVKSYISVDASYYDTTPNNNQNNILPEKMDFRIGSPSFQEDGRLMETYLGYNDTTEIREKMFILSFLKNFIQQLECKFSSLKRTKENAAKEVAKYADTDFEWLVQEASKSELKSWVNDHLSGKATNYLENIARVEEAQRGLKKAKATLRKLSNYDVNALAAILKRVSQARSNR